MTDSLRPRRSALYMPASNPRAMAKARAIAADVIVLDLEDSVAPDLKQEARAAALAEIAAGGFGQREVVIRTNGPDTEWGMADLAAAAKSGADAVLVPKVSTIEDIARAHAALAAAPDHLQLWTMIETCGAVLRLDALGAMADNTRLSLWVMGVNDLAKEMRAQLTADRAPFLPFLGSAVAAARCHGLGILDGVCNEFRDLAVFETEARQGLLYGFDGKTLIHPDQVDSCNAVFTPSEEETARARRVIAAFDAPEAQGKGAIQLDGKMVELLHRDQALRLVAVAERIAAGA